MAKKDGLIIAIQFNLPITSDVSGDAEHFSATFDAYDMIPGGVTAPVERTPTAAELDAEDNRILRLTFAEGNQTSFQNAAGEIIVTYDGRGLLAGDGGPVAAFAESFTPTGLEYKGGHQAYEHLEITGIQAAAPLTAITYKLAEENEHLEIVGMQAAAVLTDIRDL